MIKPKQYVELSSWDVRTIIKDYLLANGYAWIDDVDFVISHGRVDKVRCEYRNRVPVIQRIRQIARDRYIQRHSDWKFRVRAGDSMYDELGEWAIQ